MVKFENLQKGRLAYLEGERGKIGIPDRVQVTV
jgi:hypothetical protein